jgi:hypothetical protein
MRVTYIVTIEAYNHVQFLCIDYFVVIGYFYVASV